MKNFSERFDIVYEQFVKHAKAVGGQASRLAFGRFLDASRGSVQAWVRGQLPNAEDMLTIHDKLGFAYRWLITGEGPMFDAAADQEGAGQESPETAARLQALEEKNAALEAELREERSLNRKLTARLLLGDDGKDTAAEARAAGHE